MLASSAIRTFLLATLTLTCYHTGSTTTTVNALSPPPLENGSTRRAFVSTAVTTAAVLASSTGVPGAAVAADGAKPKVVMEVTDNGIKYAVTRQTENKGGVLQGGYAREGDIVAIEYTGYLANGQIFDATHAEGQNKVLQFILGGNAVIPGLNDIVSNMKVGQKVQAIVPPEMAFGDKGICNADTEECLIKPGSTLVYDVYFKKKSIPPP